MAMKYKSFKNEVELSVLGMGNMRLPVIKDEQGTKIDYEAARSIIDLAIENGINYFDTAYVYHSGESEVVLGKALSQYPRDSFYVADKFNISANPDYKAQFAEQLERLQMDYIDFYLLHAVQGNNWDRFENNGSIEYFDNLKKQGKIRYFGFSFHGTTEVLKRALEAYKWDFVQLQLNYYDWLYEDVKEHYDILTKAGIPVIVMEPVHGGMLAELNPKASTLLKTAQPDKSVASWAMRWVMQLDNVQVILSGMSSLEQMQDNCQTISEDQKLTESDNKLIEKACAIFFKDTVVPCTSCQYCVPYCPQGLDIPLLLSIYNIATVRGPMHLNRLKDLPADKLPSACIECGACMPQCPQSIQIPKYLKELAQMMNG